MVLNNIVPAVGCHATSTAGGRREEHRRFQVISSTIFIRNCRMDYYLERKSFELCACIENNGNERHKVGMSFYAA